MSNIVFNYNTTSEPKDTFPTDPRNVVPPLSYSYKYSVGEELDGKNEVQVWISIRDKNGKEFTRFEEFLVNKSEVENCVKQSIQFYLKNFGNSDEKLVSMFESFNLDTSNKIGVSHFNS